MQVNPYLNFDGTCAEAFRFYETALGAKIVMMGTFGESPIADQMPPEARDRIMHAVLDVKGMMIMGSDAIGALFKTPQGFSVSLGIESEAEAERVFTNLSEGATIQMALMLPLAATSFNTSMSSALGIINAITAVLCFGGLTSATIMYMMGRTEFMKQALVGSAVAGLAWVIIQTFFIMSMVLLS